MQAENLVLDNCRQRKQIEQVGIILPHISVAVLAKALVIEAVDLRDLTRLMVSSQYSDAVLEANLERNEQRDGLDGVIATINVVAHE